MRTRKEASKDSIMHFASAYREDIFDGSIGDKSRLPLAGRYATFDSIDDYIGAQHLVGTETVVSVQGTVNIANITISVGRIDVADTGTIWDLILSDGTHYPFSEGSGVLVNNIGSNKDATAFTPSSRLFNINNTTFWHTDGTIGQGNTSLNLAGYSTLTSGANTGHYTSTFSKDYNSVGITISGFIQLFSAGNSGVIGAATGLVGMRSVGVATLEILMGGFSNGTNKISISTLLRAVKHYSVSVDSGGNYTLYASGNLVSEGVLSAPNLSFSNLQLYTRSSTTQRLVGSASQLAYFEGTLNSSEHEELFQKACSNSIETHSRFSDCDLYVKGGDQGVATDYSNNNITFTLVGTDINTSIIPLTDSLDYRQYQGQVHYPIQVKEHYLHNNGVSQFMSLGGSLSTNQVALGNPVTGGGLTTMAVWFKTSSDITTMQGIIGALQQTNTTYGTGIILSSGTFKFFSRRNGVGFQQTVTAEPNKVYFLMLQFTNLPAKSTTTASAVSDVKVVVNDVTTEYFGQTVYYYSYNTAVASRIGGNGLLGEVYLSFLANDYFSDDDIAKIRQKDLKFMYDNGTSLCPFTAGAGTKIYDYIDYYNLGSWDIRNPDLDCWDYFQYEYSNNHRGYNSPLMEIYPVKNFFDPSFSIGLGLGNGNYIEWDSLGQPLGSVRISRSVSSAIGIGIDLREVMTMEVGKTYKLSGLGTAVNIDTVTDFGPALWIGTSTSASSSGKLIVNWATDTSAVNIYRSVNFTYNGSNHFLQIGTFGSALRHTDFIIENIQIENVNGSLTSPYAAKIPCSLTNHHYDILGNKLALPTLGGKYLHKDLEFKINPHDASDIFNATGSDSNDVQVLADYTGLILGNLGNKHNNIEL